MIAISKQINSHEITALQTNCELLWMQVAIGNHNKLYIGAYYRSHVGDQKSIDELNLSLQKLNETIRDAEIWLTGDFNAPCINWESMSLCANRTHVAAHSSLIDVMQEHGLEQIVNRPTRHQNILDLFFLNHPSVKHTIDILLGLGDHNIVCVDIEMWSEINKQNSKQIYLYYRADWDSIKEDLTNLLHSSDFSSTDTKTVDELWIKFKDTVLHSMRSHIPHKLTRTRCDLPWLTSDIRKQIKKCNKLYRQYKTSHSPEIRNRFLQLKSNIQRQMRQSHGAYISRLIIDPEDRTFSINPKTFWNFIKKLRKDSNGIQPLKVDGKISKEKANVFNSHFRSVFTNEPDKVLPDKGPSPHPLVEDVTITTMVYLRTLLQNLNIHKVSGPDTISTRLLKETAKVTAPILKKVIGHR